MDEDDLLDVDLAVKETDGGNVAEHESEFLANNMFAPLMDGGDACGSIHSDAAGLNCGHGMSVVGGMVEESQEVEALQMEGACTQNAVVGGSDETMVDGSGYGGGCSQQDGSFNSESVISNSPLVEKVINGLKETRSSGM